MKKILTKTQGNNTNISVRATKTGAKRSKRVEEFGTYDWLHWMLEGISRAAAYFKVYMRPRRASGRAHVGN